MFQLTIILFAAFLSIYSVVADQPKSWNCDQSTTCCCGGQLGLVCGSRIGLNQNEHGGIPLLRGQCKDRAFYQCSAIDQPAVFKGMCPKCRLSKPGVDKCFAE
ncbi:uncharacterized protein LOC128960424 [Oppia nitens]|uniref:uncharacterized protein LOC128960424 n=1 Tax=Oppia nitens TaxID=1686743 RepID=UPI0023D9BDF7|nr:uncharacterized protein LOC128960424 [Oppia nitens]